MSPLARAASLLLFVLSASSASASVLTPLCVFGASTCGGGAAGYYPTSALIHDSSGTLYGPTSVGGAHNGGVVFMLTSGGSYSEIYAFCAAASCADGQTP